MVLYIIADFQHVITFEYLLSVSSVTLKRGHENS